MSKVLLWFVSVDGPISMTRPAHKFHTLHYVLEDAQIQLKRSVYNVINMNSPDFDDEVVETLAELAGNYDSGELCFNGMYGSFEMISSVLSTVAQVDPKYGLLIKFINILTVDFFAQISTPPVSGTSTVVNAPILSNPMVCCVSLSHTHYAGQHGWMLAFLLHILVGVMAMVTALNGLMSFLSSSGNNISDIQDRLDRIEKKLDSLIDHQKAADTLTSDVGVAPDADPLTEKENVDEDADSGDDLSEEEEGG